MITDIEEQPHCAGQAQCNQCRNVWVAVWPLAADNLECPDCHSTDTDRDMQ